MEIIQLVISGISSVAVFIIGVWQIKIHNRLKQLEESIALSMVPNAPNKNGLRLINSGKINLYLRKATIGAVNRDYSELVLVAIGKDPFFLLNFSQEELRRLYKEYKEKTIKVKLYLQDEWGKRYLVEGAILISLVIVKEQIEYSKENRNLETGQSVSSDERIYYFINSAWVSRIKKFKWNL